MIRWPSAVRDSTEAEIAAFDDVCQRLAGFAPDLSAEYIDGWLCALAAGPRVPDTEVWLDKLFGDTFGRVFADPPEVARAREALQARLKVLCAQLDPEALLDAPDQLRLAPLVDEWTDEDRARIAAGAREEGQAAPQPLSGALWASGFVSAVQAHADLWVEPGDEDSAKSYGVLIDQINFLEVPLGHAEIEQHTQTYWPEGLPERDRLIDEALFAVQELRLFWVDHAPRPETRRVQPTPGRNDPCPCGSGKKYKKCHGAAAAADPA
jgi:uncharacterized protein